MVGINFTYVKFTKIKYKKKFKKMTFRKGRLYKASFVIISGIIKIQANRFLKRDSTYLLTKVYIMIL